MPKLTIEEINEKVKNTPEEYIEECEKSYKDRLKAVRDKIIDSSGRKLVMLAGPSSSGKTTTAKLLRLLTEEKGRKAVIISLDDFYLDQKEGPKFSDGTPDFETVHALNIPQIISCLAELLETGETLLPQFDFTVRKPIQNARKIVLGENDIAIVEGLHALNPIITDPLENEDIIKLYVSVSTRIYDGEDILFSKRDIRFIRRMIRDYQFRNSPVDFTFYLWNGVRTGEDRYLFPFENRADIKIDSIHPYELCVYKELALNLLSHIDEDSIYYKKAEGYKEKLEKLEFMAADRLPQNSLLHEFLG